MAYSMNGQHNKISNNHFNSTNGQQHITNMGTSTSDEDSFWSSPLIQSMPEPTRMFSLLVMFVVIVRHAQSKDWDFTEPMTTGFILNPYVISFISMATASVYYGYSTRPKGCKDLPVYDRWVAEWYWWNSWLFHMVMDGASGSFRLIPSVVYQYDILDLRFPNRHVVPWIIGSIELFVMGPLCMLTAAAVLQRNPNRFGLELITSTLHITGMVVFVGAELYEGQLCIPALDPVGVAGNMWANVKFDFYHLLQYWFGFWCCNMVWGVVPLIRIKRALDECCKAFQSTTAPFDSASSISKKNT